MEGRGEEGQPPSQEPGGEGSLHPYRDAQAFSFQELPGLALVLKPPSRVSPPMLLLSTFHLSPSLSASFSLRTHTHHPPNPPSLPLSQFLSPSSSFSSSYLLHPPIPKPILSFFTEKSSLSLFSHLIALPLCSKWLNSQRSPTAAGADEKGGGQPPALPTSFQYSDSHGPLNPASSQAAE